MAKGVTVLEGKLFCSEVGRGLRKNAEAAEAAASVAATINSLFQFLNTIYQEWSRTIDSVVANQLDQPIIYQVSLGYEIEKAEVLLIMMSSLVRFFIKPATSLVNQHVCKKARKLFANTSCC